jgi:hypothetical protein
LNKLTKKDLWNEIKKSSHTLTMKELKEVQLLPIIMKQGGLKNLLSKYYDSMDNKTDVDEQRKAAVKFGKYINDLNNKLRDVIIIYSKMIGNYKAYMHQLFEIDAYEPIETNKVKKRLSNNKED